MRAETKEKFQILLKNRPLLIFVCIFLSIVIIFGATLGIIMAVMNSRAAVQYGQVRITEGEAKYLASVFKAEYMSSVRAVSDTEEFWNSDSGVDGKTHGEVLRQGFKEYISGIAIKNSLYLNSLTFTPEEKSVLKSKLDSYLAYRGYASEEEFNKMSGELGFEYQDMLDGLCLLYKASATFPLIYGEDGSNLLNYPSECDKFLEKYTHVSLIFIRDKDVYLLDSEGNIQYDEDGMILTRPLTKEERETRAKNVEDIRTYIKNLEENAENPMTAEIFEKYLKNHSDTDPEYMDKGYYFYADGNNVSEITQQFYTVYPEVVTRSLEMEIGEYSEVQCSDGVCFIYKYSVAENAYTDTENVFFSDFCFYGANYCFGENIRQLAAEVVFSDKFNSVDVVSIPANFNYVIYDWN